MAAYVGVGAADIDPAAGQIDIADPQGGGLAPAQAGIGQEENQRAPASGRVRQVVDLFVAEEDIVAAPDAGKAEPAGRIGPDAAASHGVIERS